MQSGRASARVATALAAAVRRAATHTPDGDPVVAIGSARVDLGAKKIVKDGAEVHLTPTEWGILEMLIRHRGKLVAQRELLRNVWGPKYDDHTNYLRVYLAQLRRKLEDDPTHPRYLITESGMGYRLALYANLALRVSGWAVAAAFRTLLVEGTSARLDKRMLSWAERQELVGLPEWEALDEHIAAAAASFLAVESTPAAT